MLLRHCLLSGVLRWDQNRLQRPEFARAHDAAEIHFRSQEGRSHPALFDQIHHRQKALPVPGQEPAQFLFVDCPLLAYRVAAFLRGGTLFKVWQPDSKESG